MRVLSDRLHSYVIKALKKLKLSTSLEPECSVRHQVLAQHYGDQLDGD
jgi:hypothetical protein